jgi:hypothetical protein
VEAQVFESFPKRFFLGQDDIKKGGGFDFRTSVEDDAIFFLD